MNKLFRNIKKLGKKEKVTKAFKWIMAITGILLLAIIPLLSVFAG